MMLIKNYVAPSGIQGNGLFAGEPIKKGTRIWIHVDGFEVEFRKEAIDAMAEVPRDYLIRYTYPHYAKPGIMVLDGDNGRFMNHSDAPNTDFSIGDFGVTTRDVAEGEELTCNYNEFDGEIDF